MIHIVKRAAVVPYSVVWFPEAADVPEVEALRSAVTVIRQASPEFLQRYAHRVIHSRTFCTAVADLTQTETQLYDAMNRTCRYQVRKGLELGAEFSVTGVDEAPVSRALIDDFYRKRFGKPVSASNWAVAQRHGCASQITLDGQVVSVNVHLVDGLRRVRTLYGATLDRAEGGLSTKTISTLNRTLSWLDMIHFRQLGVRQFDAGGLFDDPDHAFRGIDDFKLSFGLQRHYEHHALTSPFRLARQGMKLLGRGA